jgi:L,D-peptidoglycan transpeptidase YkuD (ErfK/YbiS/YcfS/YnhG family)
MSSADLRLHVQACPGRPTQGRLVAGGLAIPCALGRTGTARRKREGDGATPIGTFGLRRLYYRPDRVARPATALPVEQITPRLGWSDDPLDPRYNAAVPLPSRFGHECLWRADQLYDYLIVLGYNDRPALRPLGSAIFLHLARDGLAPTDGCVAIGRDAMRRLVSRLGPWTQLTVHG